MENAKLIFDLAREKHIHLTPPPKAIFEEKMLFALLWNWNLRGFWRRELGEAFFQRLLKLVPYTWLVDPAALPPHGAIPELNITDWRQLKTFSQREREARRVFSLAMTGIPHLREMVPALRRWSLWSWVRKIADNSWINTPQDSRCAQVAEAVRPVGLRILASS